MNQPRLEDFGLTQAQGTRLVAQNAECLRRQEWVSGLSSVLGLLTMIAAAWRTFTAGTLATVLVGLAGTTVGWALMLLADNLDDSFVGRVLGTARDQRAAAFTTALNQWNAELERRKVEFWTNLSGTEFETEVCTLFRESGCSVEHVGGVGDEGIDLWFSFEDARFPAQCKQHGSPVGPRVVREFLGACAAAGADYGVLVTTRGVTKAARRVAAANGIVIYDVHDLLNLGDEVASRRDAPDPERLDSAGPIVRVLMKKLVEGFRGDRP